MQHVGFLGGGNKEDRVSDSELPPDVAQLHAGGGRAERDRGGVARERAPARRPRRAHEHAAQASPLDAQLDAMMGDAPVCDVCGHITVRNGACYKCLNCGNSMGCS